MQVKLNDPADALGEAEVPRYPEVKPGEVVVIDAKGRKLLNSGILSDVRITADVRANALVISSPPENLDLLRERSGRQCRDEIKFVLSSVADFHWARAMVEQQRLEQIVPVLFSPVRPLLDPQTLAQLLLEHRLPVRLQLQLHTLLWPDQTRGV